MNVRTRLLLVVAAVLLVLSGTTAGWAIAVSRRATVSDAIASAILTGVFTLLGAGIGLVVPMIQEWEHTRPDLKLQLSYRCLHASPTGVRMATMIYPAEFTGGHPPLMTTWLRCPPDDAPASLFLFLDLQAQNRSYLDDAITEITIEVPVGSRTAHMPARLPDGSEFFGESIPTHQLRSLRLRLMLDRQNYAKTPNWVPGQEVVWRLVVKTINDQTISGEIRPAGHFLAFEEGQVDELTDWPS